MINPLVFTHSMVCVETIQCLLFDPEDIPIILTPRIFSFLERINDTQTDLRSISEFSGIGSEVLALSDVLRVKISVKDVRHNIFKPVVMQILIEALKIIAFFLEGDTKAQNTQLVMRMLLKARVISYRPSLLYTFWITQVNFFFWNIVRFSLSPNHIRIIPISKYISVANLSKNNSILIVLRSFTRLQTNSNLFFARVKQVYDYLIIPIILISKLDRWVISHIIKITKQDL